MRSLPGVAGDRRGWSRAREARQEPAPTGSRGLAVTPHDVEPGLAPAPLHLPDSRHASPLQCDSVLFSPQMPPWGHAQSLGQSRHTPSHLGLLSPPHGSARRPVWVGQVPC